nr:SCAR1 [Dictyostelium discoideum]
MVLITRYLPSVTDNNQPALEGQSKDQIVDTVITSTTVGIINQLTMLVAHSNSIFTALANDANLVTQRIEKLGSRIRPLIQSIPSIEDYHRNTSIDTMNSKPRAEFHADNSERNQHFTHASIPASINTVYEKCKPPPNLQLLDPYMDDGQKSLKLYTNPDFFMDEWVAEQQKLHEEARQRKRERREARLKKKGEKNEVEVKKVKSVTKVRYDPVTGEKITINIESPHTSSPQIQHQSNNTATPQHTTQHFGTNQYQAPPPPPLSQSSPSQQHSPINSYTPPPPPLNTSTPSPSSSFQGRPPSTGFNTPPPPMSNNNNMPPPPPMQQNGGAANNRLSVHNSAPIVGAPAPPPPPPPPSAPAPPPPPMAKAGGGASDIKPKASGARSDLLSSIMQGMALKPAEERKVAEAPKKEEALNVADILARRIAWAGDSDSSEDESDDSDWD